MQHTTTARRRVVAVRAGATLIELLAVIVIMTLLAAAAVPILAPAMANRQVREASRIVSGFLTGARNRAMLSGRPVGVVLDRLQGLPEACVALSYAEVPAPYAGDSTGSIVAIFNGQVTFLGSGITDPSNSAQTPSTDVGWMSSIRVGDFIRLNYQGPHYQLVAIPNTKQQAFDLTTGFYITDPAKSGYRWQLNVLLGAGNALPPNGFYRYQIIRAPIKLAAGGVQLPGPTVIDLDFSGFDLGGPTGALGLSPWTTSIGFQPLWPPAGVDPTSIASQNPFTWSTSDQTSVVITFAPSGAIDAVWGWGNQFYAPGSDRVPYPYKPITPVRLLIGRRELLPLPTTPPANIDPTSSDFKPYLNWQDPGNFWVSINQQSGLVATVENNPPQGVIGNSGVGTFAELMNARHFALEAQRVGGR